MSRDFLDELSHSWGNTPKQKAREKEYNHQYYLKNKEKWKSADRISKVQSHNKEFEELKNTIKNAAEYLSDSEKQAYEKLDATIRPNASAKERRAEKSRQRAEAMAANEASRQQEAAERKKAYDKNVEQARRDELSKRRSEAMAANEAARQRDTTTKYGRSTGAHASQIIEDVEKRKKDTKLKNQQYASNAEKQYQEKYDKLSDTLAELKKVQSKALANVRTLENKMAMNNRSRIKSSATSVGSSNQTDKQKYDNAVKYYNNINESIRKTEAKMRQLKSAAEQAKNQALKDKSLAKYY